jgi:hypothetical protein
VTIRWRRCSTWRPELDSSAVRDLLSKLAIASGAWQRVLADASAPAVEALGSGLNHNQKM